ncbi:MAG: NADH-quinone oxidoreductase subunit H [Myxococcales bacterium]|nr:MAG: NADH-quinone oxidoreductase subunit H [Myxococcales bacterium]
MEHVWLAVEALVKIAVLLGFGMTLAAVLTWQERKQSAAIQDRIGPNRALIPYVGWRLWGLPHLMADGIKMIFKEDFTPANANRFLFQIAPLIAIMPLILSLAVIPFGGTVTIAGHSITLQVATLNAGLLFIFAFGSLSVYASVLGGFAADNKFGLIGSMRTTAQLFSYEVAMGLTLVGLFIVYQTVMLDKIAAQQGGSLWNWGVVVQPAGFLLFFAAAVAETKRAPFDLPEGESEIIGYFLEYSGLKFGLFFIGEFMEVVISAMLITTMFFGSYHLPWLDWSAAEQWLNTALGSSWLPGVIVASLMFLTFVAKVLFFCFLQLQIRWTLPRFRYDQVMNFGWKFLLPLALANVVITALVVLIADSI